MHNTIVYYFCVLSVCAAKLASMGVAESVRRETVPWRCRKQKPRSHPTPTAANTTGTSSACSLRQRHKLGLNLSLILLQLGEGRRPYACPKGQPAHHVARVKARSLGPPIMQTRINNRLLLTKTSCKAMTLPVTRQEPAAGEPCSLHKTTWKGSRITSNLAKKINK